MGLGLQISTRGEAKTLLHVLTIDEEVTSHNDPAISAIGRRVFGFNKDVWRLLDVDRLLGPVLITLPTVLGDCSWLSRTDGGVVCHSPSPGAS